MIRCSNVTFLDGLNQVCRADGMTYIIVWDNVMFHHAQMVQAWFQAHPQFTTL
jgi:glutamate-1-semialdehyde aminotransferase